MKSKKIWLNLLRLAISLGALAFLIWQIDLGAIVAELRRAALLYLLIALVLYLVSLAVRAYRWFVLLRGLGLSVPFTRLLHLYYVGQFFNTFLPSTFGGDVVRVLELTQDTESSAAIGTVLLDRMSGLLVLAAMGLVALPFQLSAISTGLLLILIGVVGGVLIGGSLILEGEFLQRMTHWLPKRLSLTGEGPLARLYSAITGCGTPAIRQALLVSLVFNVINVIINWLCGVALGTGIDLGYFFAVTPLLSVSGLIPSIGGWGVRETVSAALFSAAGAEPDAAAALGVALGLITLVAGMSGGMIYAVAAVRKIRDK